MTIHHGQIGQRAVHMVFDCVQMSLTHSSFGQWVDQPCNRLALIACEKKQELTINLLHNAIENITVVIEEKDLLLDDVLNSIQVLNRTIENIEKTVESNNDKIQSLISKNSVETDVTQGYTQQLHGEDDTTEHFRPWPSSWN